MEKGPALSVAFETAVPFSAAVLLAFSAHVTHEALCTPCGQICEPRHAAQWLFTRRCTQICDPLHSLQYARTRLWWQMELPPQSLHW
jgi:hypothetical protein